MTLECASYDADLDPVSGANGPEHRGGAGALGADPAADAGPLVFTTGSDVPSSLQLPVWLSRSGADVLKGHPIVSVDRRGIRMSSPIDCRDSFDRQEMRDQAQFESGDDPVADLGAITMTATTGCTDMIAPGDSAYDNARAAGTSNACAAPGMPALALIGVGNGAAGGAGLCRVAPGQGGPAGARLTGAARGERRNARRGAGERVSRWRWTRSRPSASRSTARWAPTRRARSTVLAAARGGRGPGGMSVAVLANAIVTALGFPSGDRIGSTVSLANALAAARGGDTNQLNSLVTRAESMRDSDGQFVNTCSDSLNRPTPTGCANWWWPGASSTRSSAPSARSTWSSA